MVCGLEVCGVGRNHQSPPEEKCTQEPLLDRRRRGLEGTLPESISHSQRGARTTTPLLTTIVADRPRHSKGMVCIPSWKVARRKIRNTSGVGNTKLPFQSFTMQGKELHSTLPGRLQPTTMPGLHIVSVNTETFQSFPLYTSGGQNVHK